MRSGGGGDPIAFGDLAYLLYQHQILLHLYDMFSAARSWILSVTVLFACGLGVAHCVPAGVACFLRRVSGAALTVLCPLSSVSAGVRGSAVSRSEGDSSSCSPRHRQGSVVSRRD